MDVSESVLFANEMFYHAFSTQNFEMMADLWAKNVAVACIHPGHPPLLSRERILSSWKSILGAGGVGHIECRDPKVHLYAEVAFVVCYESLPEGYLLATNIFVQQEGHWKMVHHHVGPTAGQPQQSPLAQLNN